VNKIGNFLYSQFGTLNILINSMLFCLSIKKCTISEESSDFS